MTLLRLLVLRDGRYYHLKSVHTAQQLSIPLSILFSKSFNSTSLPLAWKEALVTPIYKKGDRTVVSNYRPISLTFPIVKTMESIIRDRIQEHMTTNNLINMVLVLEDPVLLSYSLQLIPGQISWGELCNWCYIFQFCLGSWFGSSQMFAC